MKIEMKKMFMRLIWNLVPSYGLINAKFGLKGPEFVLRTNSDRKIKISNCTIFEEKNSFLRSVFEN